MRDILQTVVERYHWHEAEALQQIELVWPAAVGSLLAQVTTPLSFLHGQLTVAVPSPVWVQELGYLKQTLLAEVNQRLQGVQVGRLRFVVRTFAMSAPGPGPEPPEWVARLKALRERLEQEDNRPPPG